MRQNVFHRTSQEMYAKCNNSGALNKTQTSTFLHSASDVRVVENNLCKSRVSGCMMVPLRRIHRMMNMPEMLC